MCCLIDICGFCGKIKEINELIDNNIEVRYLLFSRNGKDDAAYDEMKYIWCSEDRKLSVEKAFNDEDIDLLMSNLSDTLKWSPPQYNNNVTLGYEEYKQTILGYFDQFDNITFYESEGSLFNVKSPAFWAGSVFSSVIDSATTSPLNMRVYGTWKAIHTESGAEVGNKWYGLFGFNEDGKIASISDWMDVSGMQNQIENHIIKGE